ncbi:MAG: methyltransferase [Aestuariibacter sp.]
MTDLMKTDLTLGEQSRALYRYPPKSQHKSLQAWDSADELLIQYVTEHPLDFNTGITILNDDFGALTCFLHSQVRHWYSDSQVAHLALSHNLTKNGLDASHMTVHKDLQTLNGQLPVLMKLPKSNEFLTEILIHLRQSLPDGALVVAGAKTTAIHTSTLKLFEQHLGKTTTSLAQKKSRLILARVNKGLTSKSHYPVIWPVPDSSVHLVNFANVFANQQLDIGARFLLQHMPHCKDKRVVDLGCGNGVLGVSCLHNAVQMGTPKSLHFVDESYMAIQSAKASVELLINSQPTNNQPEIYYHHSNCLENADTGSVDVILCNPPFHQQQTITDHIAWQMFVEAKESLQKGGELRIVGNRHLDYHQKLKRLFGGYSMVASNKKFVILSSKKR